MQNNRIEKLLPVAYDALKNNGTIVKGNEIEKALRGQISSFGAAILTGSLASAVAFYSNQGHAKTPRQALLDVIFQILKEGKLLHVKDQDAIKSGDVQDLKDLVLASEDPELQEKITDASIAIKLAMNFFTLT